MIRACRIPPVLNRVCDESIPSALLVTFNGEIIGESTKFPHHKDPAFFGTLVADIALDYQRAGEDYASIEASKIQKSHLQSVLIEMEGGTVGISACSKVDIFAIAVARPDTPPGLLKARLEQLTLFVEESLSEMYANP